MQKVHLNTTHGGFLKYGRSQSSPVPSCPALPQIRKAVFRILSINTSATDLKRPAFLGEKSFQSVFLWEIHEIHWNMMFVFVGGYGGYHSDLTSPESEKFSEIWCWARQFLKIDKHSEYHQQKSWTSPIPPGIKKKIKRKNTLFSYSSMGFQALCDWDAIEVHGPNEAVEEMSIISIGNDPALLRCLRMKWCRIVPTACWL